MEPQASGYGGPIYEGIRRLAFSENLTTLVPFYLEFNWPCALARLDARVLQ
jgi:hypothetical protein